MKTSKRRLRSANPRVKRWEVGHSRRRSSLEMLERRNLLAAEIFSSPLADPAVALTAADELGAWVAQGPFSATDGQVENVSPSDQIVGAIHTVLAHPTDADILYIGATNGGVWKTENATSVFPNWQPLTDSLPSQSIGAMAFDSADATSETIYVGTGRYSSFGRTGNDRVGLYKTTDGGQTWAILDDQLIGANISGVAANGNNVVVSVNVSDTFDSDTTGIFRSINGGLTFTQVSSGTGGATGLPGGVSYDLVADPNDPDTLYTSIVSQSNSGIFKSIDGGASWNRISNAAIEALILGNGTSNLELAVGRQDNVYAAIINFGDMRGLFRSDNGGNSWTQMDSPRTNENGTDVGLNPRGSKGPGPDDNATPAEIAGGQGSIHFSILADPNDPNLVYVGGDRQPRTFGDTGSFPNSIGATDFTGRLFRGDASQPAGSQFVHLTHSSLLGAPGGGTASSSSPHADSREMVFDANGNIIEVDDGGVYRRTNPQDNTGDWFGIIGDLQITEAHDIDYDNLSNTIMVGNQDTGTTYQPSEGAPTWVSLSTADGGDIVIDNVSLAAQNQSVRYSSFQGLGAFRRSVWDASGALISETFPALSGFNGDGVFRTPVELNTVDPTRLAIQGGTQTYESSDQGESVDALGTAPNRSITQNAVAYGGVRNGQPNPDVLWVGSGSDVYVRPTAGSPLAETGDDPTGGTIRDLTIDPDDWGSAFVIDSNSVFATSDVGNSWIDVTGDLLSFATSFYSVEYASFDTEDALLVGTNLGIYASLVDSLGAWTLVGTGLPTVLTYDMVFDPIDDVLVAGTLGRGAWTLEDAGEAISPDTSIPTPVLTGPVSPTNIEPFDVTIDFGESVTGFDQSEVNVTNGFLNNFIDRGNGLFTVTIDALVEGPVNVFINADVATDIDGNLNRASRTLVIVVDTTAPELTVPADLVAEANTVGGATITEPTIATFLISAIATDNFDSSPTITTDAPSQFPLGDTVVTFTATDDAGNRVSDTATVTVVDTTPPAISLPPNSTLDGTTTAGALITNEEIAAFLALGQGSDIVDAEIVVTNDAPAIFPLGETVVTFSAIDQSGNEGTASAIMTVEDTTAPTIVVPANISLEPETAAGVAGSDPAIVAFLSGASATDIVDDSLIITNDGPDQYPIGDTVVIFTATDDSGNQTARAATVSVTDQSPPSIVVPSNMSMEGDVLGGASIENPTISRFLGAVSASDTIDEDVAVSHDAPEVFPVGETVVTFIATDDGGNRASGSAIFTVSDTTGPTVSVPAGVELEANTLGGFLDSDTVVTWLLAQTNVDDSVQEFVNVSHDAPELLPLGINAITITATDGVGNSSSATTSVTIVDTISPELQLPPALFLSADSGQGIADSSALISDFLSAAIAVDLVDGSTTVTHDAPTTLPVGTTSITFTATDASGNLASASSSVTVFHTIDVPERLEVEGDTIHGTTIANRAIAEYIETVVASHQSDPTISVTHNAPDFFVLGLTVITFTTTDTDGNVETDQRRVTVNDSIAPEIEAPGDLIVTTDSTAGASVADDAIANFLAAFAVDDAVDAAPTITNDAPDVFPVGDTVVTFTASDLSGNASTASAVVRVDVSASDPSDRMDVNGDGQVSALDALNVINELSLRSGQQTTDQTRFDVNGDGRVSASDALAVINRIHRQSGVGEASSTNARRLDSSADDRNLELPATLSSDGATDKAATFATAEATDRALRSVPIDDTDSVRLESSIVDEAIDQLSGNLF